MEYKEFFENPDYLFSEGSEDNPLYKILIYNNQPI